MLSHSHPHLQHGLKVLAAIQVTNAKSPGPDPDFLGGLDPQLPTKVVKETCSQSQQLNYQILQGDKAADDRAKKQTVLCLCLSC